MNILLVWPPDVYGKYGTSLGKQWLPIGLGKIASYLRERKSNINIRILCAALEKFSFGQVVDFVRSRPWDIIGISYITVQAPYTFALSRLIKKYSRALLVHGGVHPTINVEETASYADFCVLHEGEETFLEIVDSLEKDRLELEEIKGIAFKKNNKLITTPPREFIKDIDEIPFPAYDLFPMKEYDDRMHVTNEPMVHIMESRGCPYNCAFCVSPRLWKRRVRWHSADYLVDYMKYIVKDYGIYNFHFHGDNLLLRPDLVEKLCQKILDQKLKVKWCALTRAEHVNRHKKILPLMKKAGCIGIELGIDSAEPEALAAINKRQKTSEVVEAFKNQKQAGLTPLFTIMSFNPEETILGYYQQQREIFSKVLNYNLIHPGQTSTPYPGTNYWERKDSLGLVLADYWEEFDHKLIPFIPYSLLRGKPKKTQRGLRFNEYLIILGTYFTCRVDLFNFKGSKLETLARAVGYIRKLGKYYSLCDGQYTVEEIGNFFAQEETMSYKEAMRFVGFATLMCAKMGLIKDMGSKKMKKKKIRPFFAGRAGRLKSILRYIYAGASFHLLGWKEKIKSPWEKD